jgi:hypothetical protein
MSDHDFLKEVSQEAITFSPSLSRKFNVFIKVFGHEAGGANNDAIYFRICVAVIPCKMLLESFNNLVKEFVLAGGVLIGEGLVVLCNTFLHFCLEHSFLLAHQENVGDALLHCDCQEVALVSFLNHLV